MKIKQILALHLACTALVVSLWILLCPVYQVHGSIQHQLRDPYKPRTDYKHRDATLLWAGTLVILLASASSFVYQLSRHNSVPSDIQNPEPAGAASADSSVDRGKDEITTE